MKFITNQYIAELSKPYFMAINRAMDNIGSLEDALLWADDDQAFRDIYNLWMNK